MPQMISMNDPATSRPGAFLQPPAQRPSQQDLNSTEVVDFNIESDDTPASQPANTAAPAKPAETKPAEKPAEEPAAAAAEVKPVEETKTDVTFDIPAEQPNPTGTTQQPAQIPQGPRNYDQYPEEIRPVLRALNNKQFAELAPKLKDIVTKAKEADELRQRVSQQPQFFYEHPEAYQIMPEYKQLSQDIQYIGFEQQHLAEQLIKIKRGEAWQELKGYDSRTGQPVFEERKPNENGTVDYVAETQVSQELNRLTMIGTQKSQQLAQFQAGYQQSVQSAQKDLAEIDKRLFPKLEAIDKLPAEEKKMYDLAIGMSPTHLRSHPLTPILGKSFVMYWRLLNMYQQSLKTIDQLRGEAEDRSVAEPSVIPAGGGTPKPPVKPGEIDPDEEVKLADLND